MSTFEDGLRTALQDLADDVRPVHLAGRLMISPAPVRQRRRTTVVALAAATVLAVLVASVLVLRLDKPRLAEPTRQPPRVVRLSGTSAAPGPARLAFSIGVSGDSEQSGYLVPTGRDEALTMVTGPHVDPGFRQQLVLDGRSLLVARDPYIDANVSDQPARVALVDLRTGRRDDLGGLRGNCVEASSDARALVYFEGTSVQVLDVRTRRSTSLMTVPNASLEAGCAGGFGWSPDGDLIAVGRREYLSTRTPDGVVVVDRRGTVVAALPGHLANRSQSWSPDGADLLVYEERTGRFLVAPLDGSAPTVLRRPVDAVSALGWAGRRVVWLTGSAGEQELVTTDRLGRDTRTWSVLDVGGQPVVDVQWSRDLSGTTRD